MQYLGNSNAIFLCEIEHVILQSGINSEGTRNKGKLKEIIQCEREGK